jgi:hypothetical protein
MRWFFLIFLIHLIYASNLFAASELNFSYTYNGPTKPNFNLELYELSKNFEDKNFIRLSSFPSGNIPLIHADEVMYSNNHKGTIFIKMDLIAPTNLRYKVIAGTNFYLYHTDTSSIAFFDFSRDEVLVLTDDIKPNPATSFFTSMFMGTAMAADLVGNCRDQTKDIFNDLEVITGKLNYNLLLKKIGECGVNALKGMDGQIENTVNFFKMLKDDPNKLWQDMKESYENLKYMMANLTSELKNIFESMRFLSMDEMLEIGCTMAGETVPSLVLMTTGVGLATGTAKIMLTVLPKLQRFSRIVTKLKRFKAPTKGMHEALSCAL